jgi:hypothetical protein
MNRKSVLLVLVALSLQACATAQTYSARPITATVVDAETGEPLEGVNVVAYWALNRPPIWQSAGRLELIEAVTDKSGQFHIPGWANKPIPSNLPRETRVGNEDPAMIVFKSGYKARGLVNDMQTDRLSAQNQSRMRYSDWDGKVIKLEKFNGNLEHYAFALGGTGPLYLDSSIECPWKRTPRYFVSLMKEHERLNRLGVRNLLPSIETMEYWFENAKCGSAKEFFREYMQ